MGSRSGASSPRTGSLRHRPRVGTAACPSMAVSVSVSVSSRTVVVASPAIRAPELRGAVAREVDQGHRAVVDGQHQRLGRALDQRALPDRPVQVGRREPEAGRPTGGDEAAGLAAADEVEHGPQPVGIERATAGRAGARCPGCARRRRPAERWDRRPAARSAWAPAPGSGPSAPPDRARRTPGRPGRRSGRSRRALTTPSRNRCSGQVQDAHQVADDVPHPPAGAQRRPCPTGRSSKPSRRSIRRQALRRDGVEHLVVGHGRERRRRPLSRPGRCDLAPWAAGPPGPSPAPPGRTRPASPGSARA